MVIASQVNLTWHTELCGDNFSDLFLVCDDGDGRRSYQIWVNKKDDGFFLSRRGSLPSGVQSISFADIGMSGRFASVISLNIRQTGMVPLI